MKLLDFYRKYGFNNAMSMLNAILETSVQGFTKNKQSVRKQFVNFIKTENIEFELPGENTLELMRTVNKMVKSPDCPTNRKNKFYMMKHRYIKTMLEDGRVDKILESENLYHFYIRGYDFHQLKSMFKNVKTDGTEDYIKDQTSRPFSEEDYRKCIIKMVYDISVSRRNKLINQ